MLHMFVIPCQTSICTAKSTLQKSLSKKMGTKIFDW